MNSASAPVDVLHEIMDHLRLEGLASDDLEPLLALILALDDHAEGKPNPLLACVKLPGRRLHGADNLLKCYAAAWITVLQRNGRSKRVAANLVASALATNGENLTASSVEGWHREISTERNKTEWMFSHYRAAVDSISAIIANAPSHVEIAARESLARLPRQKL